MSIFIWKGQKHLKYKLGPPTKCYLNPHLSDSDRGGLQVTFSWANKHVKCISAPVTVGPPPRCPAECATLTCEGRERPRPRVIEAMLSTSWAPDGPLKGFVYQLARCRLSSGRTKNILSKSWAPAWATETLPFYFLRCGFSWARAKNILSTSWAPAWPTETLFFIHWDVDFHLEGPKTS